MKTHHAIPASIPITLGMLLFAQIAYLCLSDGLIYEWGLILRPALCVSLAAVYYVLAGKDERPVPKGRQSALLASIGALLYFSAILIAGLISGFGRNILFPGFFSSLWTGGATVIASEYLRFRMIKAAPQGIRYGTAVALTLVFSFAQLDLLRNAASFSLIDAADYFFTAAVPALALHGVLTYMAFEGSLPALLILRGAHTMAPLLLPVLPNIPMEAWVAASVAVLFITLIIYHTNIRDKNRNLRRLTKRRLKYARKPARYILASAVLIAAMAVFAMRGLPYFPLAVLTDSMTGTLDRGSVVLVEKLKPEDVHSAVGEGDVIIYLHRGVEVVHRVIELRHDADGGRAYITKGDANNAPDASPVAPRQIIGIARAYFPYIGYPAVLLSNIIPNS